jgi:hypothetical protein
MGHPANVAVNFDSPSAAAALGALGLGGSLDLNLDNVGSLGHLNALGRVNEDERARRLDVVINILNVSPPFPLHRLFCSLRESH